MKYNFDEVIDRRGTASEKWDNIMCRCERENAYPAKVADMDFATPDFVIDALRQRLSHPILSYSFRPDGFYESFIEFEKRQHGWSVERDWILSSQGVMYGICSAIQTFTCDGDGVVIQPPVYPEFSHAIVNNDRKIIENPLVLDDGKYIMDFEDLDKKLVGAKMFILCNPQNPTGRSFTKDELTKVGELCMKHGVIVVADEIHCDLTLVGNKHTNFASLSDEFANNSITCISPSKTFNLAGLATSLYIIPNPALREQFNRHIAKSHLEMGNILGHTALEGAYTHGDEWLAQLKTYLEGNVEFAVEYIKTNMPKIRCAKPEATYLLWLDFNESNITQLQLEKMVFDDAAIAMYDGAHFGTGGDQCMRFNVAVPREILKTLLQNLKSAYAKI